MHVIRGARIEDLAAIYQLAEQLNSVNLPYSRSALRAIIDSSVASFSGNLGDPMARQYLFVLENLKTGDVLGTSQIVAKHGTRMAPHIYLDVLDAEHYSTSMDTYYKHQVLRLGFDYDGPTEIGGLVLAKKARGSSQKLGKQLSFARFLFIGMHRKNFREQILAELLPPLLPGKKSLLWEALGARFTGLTYQEADEISKTNKEFIKSLFPTGAIYTTLFDEETRNVIGKIGPETEGVKKMLSGLGFRPVGRVDPFDGGPHFEANTDSLWPIKELQRTKFIEEADENITAGSGESEKGLVAYSPSDNADGACSFRCAWSNFKWTAKDTIAVPTETIKAIHAPAGGELGCISFAKHVRR